MTLKEAEILAKRDYEKSIKENSEAIKRKKELKEKYDKMLQQAKNWQPPTPDHLNFKNFMIEQISSSMDFDCNAHYYYENKPVLETPKKYREEHIKGCEHDIKYHSEHYQKEVEGCAKRTKWIQDLKRALNKE